jgi:hypothetical protein
MSSFASRTVLALATLSLPGCLLDWNGLRRDASAPADTMVEPDATPHMDVASPPEAGPESTREAGPEAGPEAGIDAGVEAGREASVDAAMEAGRDATPDTSPPSDADPGCTGPVVVNEVQPGTAASPAEEFVELRNNGTCQVDLSGWRIMYSSIGGSNPAVLYLFAAGSRLPPQSELLIQSIPMPPPPPLPPGRFTPGIAASGGVAIYNRTGRVDSVVFGTPGTAMHPFVEPFGMIAATAPSTSQSVARVPNGRDTDNNAADFRVGTPSPGMPNP